MLRVSCRCVLESSGSITVSPYLGLRVIAVLLKSDSPFTESSLCWSEQWRQGKRLFCPARITVILQVQIRCVLGMESQLVRLREWGQRQGRSRPQPTMGRDG